MKKLVPFLFLVVLGVSAALAAPERPKNDPPKLRLPAGVTAVDYDIHLKLIPGAENFSGEVLINLKIDKEAAAEVLWLNGSPEIDIQKVTLTQPGRGEIAPEIILPQPPDFLGFRFRNRVSAGPGQLRITYRGKLLRHEGVGLFNEHEGNDDYIFTDFEPFDARRAFPCFDEPAQKVPVRFTLDVPTQHVASSNAPIESETPLPDGLKRVVFRRTPPLPTYLWAIAVGPFGVVDAGVGGSKRVPLRILTLRGRESQGRYAASVTAPLIDLLERYTGVPFPYDKLDQVGVPNQGHAMENPGLITYGQRLILIGPENDTVSSRRRFARVCAHELAHHWTGDLVTLRYWDETWLNESFASFLGSKVTDQYKPEWGERLDRVLRRQDAMEADSLISARRIRQPITSNDDIVNAFDPITYAKGQTVLALIESWLGEPVFQKGLNRFLVAHAHKNATAQDFLKALSAETEAAGKRAEAAALPKVLESFLDQPGVPVVSVSMNCAEASAPVSYKQRRYLPLGAASPSEKALLYRMPLCLETDAGKRRCLFVEGDSGRLPLGDVQSPCAAQSYVQLDPEESRYARVHYEGVLLDRMVARGFPILLGEAPKLNTAQQLALLLDMTALVRSGDLPADRLLPVTARAAAVPGRHLVTAAARSVGMLRELVPAESRPNLQRFVRKTFAPRLDAVGLRARAGEDEDTSLLRAALLPLVLGESDAATLQAESERLVSEWLANPRKLDAETANALVVAAPQRGGEALWQSLFTAAKTTKERNVKSLLIDALGQFRSEALAKKSLALILSGDFETREAMRILWGAAGHPDTRPAAYAFVKQNFETLVAKLPRDAGSHLSKVAAGFCADTQRADAEAFFNGRSTRYVGGPRVLKQALERIDQCSRLKRAESARIAAFLKSY